MTCWVQWGTLWWQGICFSSSLFFPLSIFLILFWKIIIGLPSFPLFYLKCSSLSGDFRPKRTRQFWDPLAFIHKGSPILKFSRESKILWKIFFMQIGLEGQIQLADPEVPVGSVSALGLCWPAWRSGRVRVKKTPHADPHDPTLNPP